MKIYIVAKQHPLKKYIRRLHANQVKEFTFTIYEDCIIIKDLNTEFQKEVFIYISINTFNGRNWIFWYKSQITRKKNLKMDGRVVRILGLFAASAVSVKICSDSPKSDLSDDNKTPDEWVNWFSQFLSNYIPNFY